MLKVLIVDDEALARVGIKSMIPWERHGFAVVGEADNGERALEMIRKLKPDIVITDIKMPILDGVGLIKAVRAERLDARFVVLSTYDDFQYVKEVMKHGAEDYIIKLEMQPEQLLDILCELSHRIRQERQIREADIEREKQQLASLSALRERLFKDWAYGLIRSGREIADSLHGLDLRLPEQPFVCLAIRADGAENGQRMTNEQIHVQDYAMLNVAAEIQRGYKWCHAFRTKPMEIAMMYAGEEERLDRLIKQLAGALRHYLNLSVSIGLSRWHSDAPDFKLAYEEAVAAVDRGFMYPAGSVIRFEELAHGDNNPSALEWTREIRRLEAGLEVADEAAIRSAFGKIVQKLRGANASSRIDLQGLCSVMIFVVFAKLEDRGGESAEEWKRELQQQIGHLAVLPDFLLWLERFQSGITGHLREMTESRRIVTQTKHFIHQYFKDDLSLEIVSDYLNISRKYLSYLFKKETGQRFIDYVTAVRIGHAKELLWQSDYKIYEVGQMVGYENEHYFSRLFKKVTGKSPAEFKNAAPAPHTGLRTLERSPS